MKKKLLNEEYITVVRRFSNSAHIILNKQWLNKKVKINIEEIEDDEDIEKQLKELGVKYYATEVTKDKKAIFKKVKE